MVNTTYVVRGLRKNLLSLPEITALQLASRVDAVSEEEDKSKWVKKFHKVFKALRMIR